MTNKKDTKDRICPLRGNEIFVINDNEDFNACEEILTNVFARQKCCTRQKARKKKYQ